MEIIQTMPDLLLFLIDDEHPRIRRVVLENCEFGIFQVCIVQSLHRTCWPLLLSLFVLLHTKWEEEFETKDEDAFSERIFDVNCGDAF